MSKASEPDDWTNKFPGKPYPGGPMSDQLDRERLKAECAECLADRTEFCNEAGVSEIVECQHCRDKLNLIAENERLEGELAEARRDNGELRDYAIRTEKQRDEARKRRETLEAALQYILETRTLCNSDKCAYRNHDLPSCPYGKARAALASEQEGKP